MTDTERPDRVTLQLVDELQRESRRVIDVEGTAALIDRSTLALDDIGYATNVVEACDALLERKPWLVAPLRPTLLGHGHGGADLGAREDVRPVERPLKPEEVMADARERAAVRRQLRRQRAGLP